MNIKIIKKKIERRIKSSSEVLSQRKNFFIKQAIIGSMTIIAIILFSIPTIASASEQVENTIVDEWTSVEVPPPPELKSVTFDPEVTALLILDIQNQNCNKERRPRCVVSIAKIQNLLNNARTKGIVVVYSTTR